MFQATEVTLHSMRFTTPTPRCRMDRIQPWIAHFTAVLTSRRRTRTGRARRHRSPVRSATTRSLPWSSTEMDDRHELETTEVTSHLCARVAPPPTPRRRVGHVLLRITTRPGAEPAMKTHRSPCDEALSPPCRPTSHSRNRPGDPQPKPRAAATAARDESHVVAARPATHPGPGPKLL